MKNPYIPLEELDIYKQAMDLGGVVWLIVSEWHYFERDTIGKQFVKAVDSIAANISEGYGRYHFAERKTFFYYARGSLFESMTWLDKAEQRALLTTERYAILQQSLKDLHLQLNVYIKKLKENQKSQ